MDDVRILIVDDEAGIAQLCGRLLNRAGYAARYLTDSAEAMEYIAVNPVDLLVVDIRMPAVGGFDVIRQLQKHQPEAAILIMTGFGTVETAIQALKEGVDGLLLKPFERGDEFLQAVKQALLDKQNKRDSARMQTLRPLFDLNESLLKETSSEALIGLIVNAVCGHLRCDNAAYYQRPNAEATLELLASRGNSLPLRKSKESEALVYRIDATGEPAWVNVAGPGDAEIQRQVGILGFTSIMCVPVPRLNYRALLFAGRGKGQTPFREADWEMFVLLARQAAGALENAYLYEELRAYVRQVEDSQQALIRAEKMSAAGRLTASIAHEINNPLQAVQNCLHLAMKVDVPEKKRHEYFQMANQELSRLMTTVQRMLDFYRPGAVSLQKIDVAGTLRRVIDLLSTQLGDRSIHISTGFSSRLPKIMAVESQLEQVFINLILNAYDAMPDGGDLRISARPVKDVVEILFQDSGAGVSRELRNRIFEPFVSTKDGGTGLGLSVSYGIISAHGGNLDLVPDKGPGACFRIVLPVQGGSS